MASVSKSGATASRPQETGIAHFGNIELISDLIAGRASVDPTMKCVIAEAIAFSSMACALQQRCADSPQMTRLGVRLLGGGTQQVCENLSFAAQLGELRNALALPRKIAVPTSIRVFLAGLTYVVV